MHRRILVLRRFGPVDFGLGYFEDDAWIDHTKTKIGYEIPFTRHFYVYKPPRPLAEIDAELKALEAEIQVLLGEVTL